MSTKLDFAWRAARRFCDGAVSRDVVGSWLTTAVVSYNMLASKADDEGRNAPSISTCPAGVSRSETDERWREMIIYYVAQSSAGKPSLFSPSL